MKHYKITEEQITALTLQLGALVEASGVNKAKLITYACMVLDGVEEIEEPEEQEEQEEQKGEESDGTEH